ncbi:putative HEAT repeat-containing domain protein [Trichinella spiralis]|nr:putative HEAT repeat-containing domain protein [Trichinella spiralis]
MPHSTTFSPDIRKVSYYQQFQCKAIFLKPCTAAAVANFVKNRRQYAFCSLVLFGMFLLLRYYFFYPNESSLNDGKCSVVFEHIMQSFKADADIYDAVIVYADEIADEKPVWLPYTGNGYITVDVSEKGKMYIRGLTDEFLDAGFRPIVDVALQTQYKSMLGAYIVHFKDGKVVKLQCYDVGDQCVQVVTTYFVHRTRPSVFIQHISISNPTDNTVILHLHRDDDTLQRFTKSRVESQSQVSAFQYTGSANGKVGMSVILSNFAKLLHAFYTVTALDDHPIIEEHTQAWNQLWNSGLSISYSKAPNGLNGDMINGTMYYILCHYELQSDNSMEFSNRPSHCYSSHSTLLPSKLWAKLNSVSTILSINSLWSYTLVEHGCGNLLYMSNLLAGATGVVQALLLSFGALKHTAHHLEFDQQPQDLHRDFFFRNIYFTKSTYVNIRVMVNDENRAIMYASVNRTSPTGKELFACDAGCLDPPIELSSSSTLIPVKRTVPATPILYVTDQREHIERLKMSIHVREVANAPAHEHHIIALHKHGHRLGGLPPAFWFSLGVFNENFYDILGVSRHASLKQIKRAFVDLSKKYHPDVNKGDRTCSSRYVKIVEAYSILSKPESRRKYDAELHAQNYSHENRERPSNKNYQSSYSYGWNSWNQSPFYYYVRQSTSQTKADDDATDVNVHIIRVVFFVTLAVYRGLDILGIWKLSISSMLILSFIEAFSQPHVDLSRGEGARRLSSPVTFGHVQPGQRFLAFHREAERRTGEAAHPMEPESYTERAPWRGRCRKTLPTRLWELALQAGISKLWTAYHSE